MNQPDTVRSDTNSLGFQRIPFFNTKRREELLGRIDSLRSHWTPFPTEGAFSLGAASYRYSESDKRGYHSLVRDLNPILFENFRDLYREITSFLSERLQSPTVLAPSIGHPGFFIVEQRGLSYSGRIYHLDIQYMGIRWKPFVPFGKLITFTGVLELPGAGGGINVKPVHMFECVNLSKEERSQKLLNIEPVYFPYCSGDLVLHDGLVYHQIAPVKLSQNSAERRVTFQGHGVKNGDTWEIYW